MNGGETIRIGTSNVSMNDSYTTVEENIFDACDGEMEVISNKSCHNTIRNNLFYECVGTLTLRHGNFATVYGNYFIGNGVKETGGIRIIGEDHKVYNNYMQGLTGTGLRSAISMMDALPNSPLNGYWQVKNPQVVGNTIIDCKQAFDIGAGKNEARILPPVNISIANNIIIKSPLIHYSDQPQGSTTEGNIVFDAPSKEILPKGFESLNPQLKLNKLHVWQPSSNELLAKTFKGPYDFIQSKQVGAPPLTNEQEALFTVKDIGPEWLRQNLNGNIMVK